MHTKEEKEIATFEYKRTTGIDHHESKSGPEDEQRVSESWISILIIVGVLVIVIAFVQFVIQLPV